MNKRKKKRIIKAAIGFALIIGASIVVSIFVNAYIKQLDEKTKEHLENLDVTYISIGNNLNGSGLYVADIKESLREYLENKKVSSVIYKFDNENFYIELEVIKDEEGVLSFNIDKIVDDSLNINARINMINVNSVEYRSSARSNEALIKINTEYDTDYFAMSKGAYHLLGDDIESISYMNEHFYYMSYNPKYEALETAESCSKEVKKRIKNFSAKDYYYRYGRINFLSDYYQKLSSKTFTVGDKCAELEGKLEKKDEE